MKDKKNLPKIVAVVVLVLVLVAGAIGGVMYMQNKPASDDQTASTAPVVAPVVRKPAVPVRRVVPAKGRVAIAKKPAKPVLAVKPKQIAKKPDVPKPTQVASLPDAAGAARGIETGHDPFWVPSTAWPGGNPDNPDSKPTGSVHKLPPLPDLAPVKDIVVDHGPKNNPPPPVPVADTVSRRVAGVVLGSGVFAILETSGESQTVQPGDRIDGGEVVAVEPDGITLRTTDNREVHIPLMASAPTPSTSAAPAFTPNAPTTGTPFRQGAPPWAQ